MADLKFLDATSGDEAPGWKDRRHLWQSAKGKRSMTPVRRRAPAKSLFNLVEICGRIEPSIKGEDEMLGLTNQEAESRRRQGLSNEQVDSSTRTVKQIIKDNVFTYFNLIFTVLAVLLIAVGSFKDLSFMLIVFANTGIGIAQEVRSKQTLDKLKLLKMPKAHVMRDGRETTVPVEDLVLDDVIILTAGSQIPADATVVEGSIQANEALITGESDEITKQKGDSLMSGSFVVAGQCHARLDAVGADSYISKLTLEAKQMQQGEQSEMIRSLDKLVKFVGIALIPIGIVLFVQSFFMNHDPFRSSITSMVAAVIGMIPEGLYLLASVALAVSSMRLASKKVLLHDMKSIETLARVDVLCVDKTGTITEPSMCVKQLVAVTADEKDNEEKEETEEKEIGEKKSAGKPDEKELRTLIGDFAKAMSNDNATMAALKEYFQDRNGRNVVKVFPFTSAVKYSAVCLKEKDGTENNYVLGAPELVLRKDYDQCRDEVQKYADKGYRVLLFGKYEGELDGERLRDKVIPYGYILLANPIRQEAPETFAYFAEQGVDVKVISGDNPLTVSEVAKEAGIKNADRYIDASTLRTEEETAEAIAEYTVFGRVTPAQKRQFVQALKAQGRTVAMTGDGVNDVLALKDADCSVAMASGSDAAVQASQVVLLESNFACMPSVVLEGRRVVNNIQRSASLFLVKNIFSFLLSLFSVVFMISYPLEPSQVSLISMFTIGIPGFFLAFQPNKDIIKGHFLTNVVLKALPAGLTDVLAVGALVVFGQEFGVGATAISTAATMLLAVVGFMILYRICQPLNLLRGIVWIGSMTGLILCSIFLPKLFAITGMSEKCIMLFVIFSIATEPVLRYLTLLVSGMRNLYRRVFKKEQKN